MKRTTMLGLVVLGIIVTAMLAMPAAAVPKTQGTHTLRTTVNVSALDPALKNDLWNLHVEGRLARFDLNVKQGTDTVALLSTYQYNTSSLSGILSNITGHRQTLVNALDAKDKTALSSVNKELAGLWKEFGTTMTSLLKTTR